MANAYKVLLDAIQTKWDGNATLSALNGLHLNEKPPSSSISTPYYVLLADDGTVWGLTSESRIWEFDITIRAYDTTAAAAASALATVTNIFDADDFSLSLSDSHEFISIYRTGGRPEFPDKEAAFSSASYRVMTSEPRA